MTKKKYFFLKSIFFYNIFCFFYFLPANAVPVSFIKTPSGNMRDINWYLLESQNIQIYYDQNAYGMGRYALSSIAESYPYLSNLMGVYIGEKSPPIVNGGNYILSKYPKIVLILGDRIEGPGFANPITQNIETQMIHPRGASFFQHELVHRLMYEHNDIHIGAPGRIFSLAMMPTWWIEGLAEYFTESLGRVETDGIIRTMALQDQWTSWESLHSLYNTDGDTNLRGYAISGRFLGWIFSQTKEKDFFKIHEELAGNTFTPFFYSASDNWLKKNLQEVGKELYTRFKNDQQKEWKNYLNNIPKIDDAKIGSALFKEEDARKTYTNGKNTLISKLVAEKSPQKSSFYVNNGPKNNTRRNTLSVYGSNIFAIQDESNSIFISANLTSFNNGSYGHNLQLLEFKGNIFKLNDSNILTHTVIPFATASNPLVVEEIESVGNGLFFIHASLRGNSLVYILDTKTNNIKKVVEYAFPAYPKFIGSNKKDCVIAIINWDKEQTSIENVCANSARKEIFAKNKLNIIDGFILENKYLRLLVSWDKLLALVDVTSDQQIQPIAAFPEWIKEISDWKDKGKTIAAWTYEKGKYKLFKYDVQKLKNNFLQWQEQINKNNPFKKFPTFVKYVPPYKKIYADKEKKQFQIVEEKHTIKCESDSCLNQDIQPLQNKKSTSVPAAYDHNFIFAFPYALPDTLGGPSVNLVAIPYQDKMERDQIQIFGGYNFFLQEPSGTASYINNRILDGFIASLFAAPLFNGTYDNQGSNTKSYNYLLQEGASLGNIIKFRPTSFELNQLISVAYIKPYSTFEAAPIYVGAQNTTLLGITENLSFNLFNLGFYLAPDTEATGDYGVWKTNASIGGGVFNSINDSQNSSNQDLGNLNYYKLNSTIFSRFSWNKQSITLAGIISTTQGTNTFNLKEYYSPFQSYILGSTASLNYVSYPILATESLFDLDMGYWSGQSSLTYKFPISKDYESLFLMSYINNFNGFLSIQEGGISPNEDGSDFHTLTTLSIGADFNMDIKGFQLYPSIFYSQLIEKAGWGVIMQIKLMDFM